MHCLQVAISKLKLHCTEFMLFTALLGYLFQLDNYCWGSVPYIELYETNTMRYFKGSWECEAFFIHHTEIH